MDSSWEEMLWHTNDGLNNFRNWLKMKSKVLVYQDDASAQPKIRYVEKPWKQTGVSFASNPRNDWLIPKLTKIKKHKRLYDFLFQFLIWEIIPNYGLG